MAKGGVFNKIDEKTIKIIKVNMFTMVYLLAMQKFITLC